MNGRGNDVGMSMKGYEGKRIQRLSQSETGLSRRGAAAMWRLPKKEEGDLPD